LRVAADFSASAKAMAASISAVVRAPGGRASMVMSAFTAPRFLWAGTVSIHPNARTGAHHHGALESVIYAVRGKARMRWGEHLEFVADGQPPQPHLPAVRHAIIIRIIGSPPRRCPLPKTVRLNTDSVGGDPAKSRMCDALESYAAHARSAVVGHNTPRAHNQQSKYLIANVPASDHVQSQNSSRDLAFRP
jgi:hypothetical protein